MESNNRERERDGRRDLFFAILKSVDAKQQSEFWRTFRSNFLKLDNNLHKKSDEEDKRETARIKNADKQTNKQPNRQTTKNQNKEKMVTNSSRPLGR
jgi:hypothetical protein